MSSWGVFSGILNIEEGDNILGDRVNPFLFLMDGCFSVGYMIGKLPTIADSSRLKFIDSVKQLDEVLLCTIECTLKL